MVPISKVESCAFTPHRCMAAPVAIVLWEYDGSIEQLDNEMATAKNLPGCRRSFHYGVGVNGVVHQYVDPDDTALSFYPSDPNCGTGSGVSAWPLASVYPGVDPNCYTINIAVTTGALALDDCADHANNISQIEWDAAVQLVCNLSKLYSIAPDALHIWHPAGDLMAPDFDHAAFIADVIACVNAPADVSGLDYLCDQIASMSTGVVAPGIMLVGADCKLYPASSLGGGGGALNPIDCTGAPIDLTANPKLATCSDLSNVTASLNPIDCTGAPIDLTANPKLATCSDLAASQTPLTVIDSPSINLTASGTNNHTLTGDVIISPDVRNGLTLRPTGLMVARTLARYRNVNAIDFASGISIVAPFVSPIVDGDGVTAGAPSFTIVTQDDYTIALSLPWSIPANGANNTTVAVAIQVNGGVASLAIINMANSRNGTANMTAQLRLNAGDVVQVVATNSTAQVVTFASRGSHFSIKN